MDHLNPDTLSARRHNLLSYIFSTVRTRVRSPSPHPFAHPISVHADGLGIHCQNTIRSKGTKPSSLESIATSKHALCGIGLASPPRRVRRAGGIYSEIIGLASKRWILMDVFTVLCEVPDLDGARWVQEA